MMDLHQGSASPPVTLYMCRGCWDHGFPIPLRPSPWRCARHGGTTIAYKIKRELLERAGDRGQRYPLEELDGQARPPSPTTTNGGA